MKRFFSFVSLAVLVAVVAAGCNFSISTANITNATLSKDVQGDKFEPVDPTTTFPADQPVIHLVANVANAPEGTKVKAVWTAVDVGDVAPANTQIAETEVVLELRRQRAFHAVDPRHRRVARGQIQSRRLSQRQVGSHAGVHHRPVTIRLIHAAR